MKFIITIVADTGDIKAITITNCRMPPPILYCCSRLLLPLIENTKASSGTHLGPSALVNYSFLLILYFHYCLWI